MNRPLARLIEVLVCLFDIVVVTGAVYLAGVLRFDIEGLSYEPNFLLRAFLFAAVVQIGLAFSSYYDFSLRSSLLVLLRRVLLAMIYSSTLLWAIYYLVPIVSIGRGIFGIAQLLTILSLILCRLLLERVTGSELFHTCLLVLGTGHLAREISKVITSRRHLGMELKGFVALRIKDPSKGEAPLDAPILGGYDELLEVIQREGIDVLVMAPEERRGHLPMMDLLKCHFAGLEVVDGLTFYERYTQKVYVHQLNPSWLIFGTGFCFSPLTIATKRLMDVVLSVIGLLLCMPFMCMGALFVKLSSPGSVFYRQVRTGRHGRPFTIFKLRTMKQVGAHGDDGRASAAKDPITWNPDTARITPVGHIMRRLHLDELPQFINVLRGDMSLVGPRPERPEYIARLEKDIPFYQQRHILRPGVSGLAQVKYDYGASVQGSLEKLQFDLSYIRNLSVANDLVLMLKTVKVVLLGREER